MLKLIHLELWYTIGISHVGGCREQSNLDCVCIYVAWISNKQVVEDAFNTILVGYNNVVDINAVCVLHRLLIRNFGGQGARDDLRDIALATSLASIKDQTTGRVLASY